MTPAITAAFAEMVGRRDDAIELDRGALLIAAHARSELDIEFELTRIGELAAGCEPSLPGVLRHLFRDLGFSGDDAEYDDPRNSFLNEVMTRRTGLPIAMSVLTIEVARRVGVDLFGVGLPGHFVVGVTGEAMFIDAFDGGRLLDVDDCARLVRAVAGSDARFDASMLAPTARRATLARMLANLKNLYLAAGDVDGATWVIRLRTLFPDSVPEEQAQLAALLASRGKARAAARELDLLADRLPIGRADRARHRAALLRASLN